MQAVGVHQLCDELIGVGADAYCYRAIAVAGRAVVAAYCPVLRGLTTKEGDSDGNLGRQERGGIDSGNFARRAADDYAWAHATRA